MYKSIKWSKIQTGTKNQQSKRIDKERKMPEARTLIHDSHNPRSIRNALGKELYEGSLRRIREFDKGNRD